VIFVKIAYATWSETSRPERKAQEREVYARAGCGTVAVLSVDHLRFLVMHRQPALRQPPCDGPHQLFGLLLAAAVISDDWEQMYGHPIYFLETFIDAERFRGTCYRAANWVLMGRATGRAVLSGLALRKTSLDGRTGQTGFRHRHNSPVAFAMGPAIARGLCPTTGSRANGDSSLASRTKISNPLSLLPRFLG
jgi:hypothetical protein